MAFTKAQTDAMNARGRALLVSAAAGSGKTFTLTRRIIDSIIEDENKTLSRMLIVTFTRSAAAELKKKISDALTEAIAAHPENARLRDELLKLGSAHISTIDSFLSSPVRENFEKLGLPASMRLADDAELTPIRNSIFKDTLDLFFDERSGLREGELSEIGHRSDYTELLSLLSGIRDTSKLIPTLLDFYMKTLTVPGGVESLKRSAERLGNSAKLDFFATEEGKVIKNELIKTVSAAALRLASLRDETLSLANGGMSAEGGASKSATALKERVYPVFEADATACDGLLRKLEGDYPSCYLAADVLKFSSFPSLRGDNRSAESENLMASRNAVLKPLKAAVSSLLKYSPDQISEHFSASSRIGLMLYEILADFDRRYSAEKLSRGICEFSDMPRFVLKLLMNDDGTPTSLALSMQKQYDEVYIDEYQDVNAIQDKIFEIIGGEHRFMVGDIKQSIYCFRDAEPSIFASYRAKFPQYDSEKPDEIPESGGSSIFMSENFRCDQGIIDFVNVICGEIFKAFADSIGYDEENDNLRFGKISASFDPPKKTVINFIEPPTESEDGEDEEKEELEADENEDKLYGEAVICANEIARLIRDKNELNADGSKIRAGDIAILVRGHSQIIPLADALTKIGVKYVTNAKNRLLDGDEMKLLLDLLTVIDNPREDIPLCRVLTASLPSYSPLLTLDDVVAVRCASGNKLSLFDALVCYGKDGENEAIREKCRKLLSLLDSFRLLASRVSADKLLRAMSRDDNLSSLCDTDAFTYLYSNACKYVKSSWNGLYSFNTYFKGLMEKGGSGSDPITAQEDEVTIITMHQSKGLEYKVCFLFGLGKSFNMKDLTNPIIFNREFGLSMKLPQKRDSDSDILSATQMAREENILWRASSILSKNKLLEEEARIFYVALTRAKERLYLSATLNKSYNDIRASLTNGGFDSINAIRSGKSYAYWTTVALLPRLESEGLFEINTIPKNDLPPLADRITREEIDSAAYGITEEDKLFAHTLNRPHGESESEKLLSLIPAKVAASKISPTMLDDSVFIPTPTGLLFSEGDEDREAEGTDNSLQIKCRIALMRSQRADFDSLLEVNKKPTAAERGSAAHLILQYCDYEKVMETGLDNEIERLVTEKFITRRTADIVKKDQLAGFFKSSLFALARSAKQTRREFHFGMFRSAADFTANEELKSSISEKKIFVQGSIDLLIETDDGIILCDYKTDRVSTEEKADRALLEKNMRERHASQLEEYRFAVKEIFGQEPIKVYIYSIPLGEIIEM